MQKHLEHRFKEACGLANVTTRSQLDAHHGFRTPTLTRCNHSPGPYFHAHEVSIGRQAKWFVKCRALDVFRDLACAVMSKNFTGLEVLGCGSWRGRGLLQRSDIPHALGILVTFAVAVKASGNTCLCCTWTIRVTSPRLLAHCAGLGNLGFHEKCRL